MNYYTEESKNQTPVKLPETKRLCSQILAFLLSQEHEEMRYFTKKDISFLKRTYKLLAERVRVTEKLRHIKVYKE